MLWTQQSGKHLFSGHQNGRWKSLCFRSNTLLFHWEFFGQFKFGFRNLLEFFTDFKFNSRVELKLNGFKVLTAQFHGVPFLPPSEFFTIFYNQSRPALAICLKLQRPERYANCREPLQSLGKTALEILLMQACEIHRGGVKLNALLFFELVSVVFAGASELQVSVALLDMKKYVLASKPGFSNVGSEGGYVPEACPGGSLELTKLAGLMRRTSGSLAVHIGLIEGLSLPTKTNQDRAGCSQN